MGALKEKYQQLTEREKWMVIVCSIVIAIGAFYWLIWSPLTNAIETNRKAVIAKQSELSWVQKNANKALQLKQSSGTVRSFSGSLTQTVNATAGRHDISISRMQPQNDELKVWVDEAEFNNVLSWLQSLEATGIKIIDVDIAQADAPGMIKIRNLQLGKA